MDHPVPRHVLHALHPAVPYSSKLYQPCHWDLSQLHFPMVPTQFKVDPKKVSVVLEVGRATLVPVETGSTVLDQDPNQDLLVHLRDQLHPLQDVPLTDHHPHPQDHFHRSHQDKEAVQDQTDQLVVLDQVASEVAMDPLVLEVMDLLVVPDQVDSMVVMDLLVVLDLDLVVVPDLLG